MAPALQLGELATFWSYLQQVEMPPILSRLLPVATSAYALQTLFAAVFVPQANEKYYDLCGALGFLSTTAVSLYYPSFRAKFYDKVPGAVLPNITQFAPRQLLVSAALCAWTVRLGSFLAMRAVKSGGDSRFDEIKTQPGKFFGFWLGQATWVFAVGLPVYLVNTIPVAGHPRLGPLDYFSVALFASSWLFEIVADHQKTVWRRAKDRKEHDEQFISSGLWSISRHPNYVGEVGLWTGIWAMSASSLTTPYAPRFTWLVAGVSPLLTWLLLRKISGVPPLESAGDKKYAGPKWEEYKKFVGAISSLHKVVLVAFVSRTVPIFWPWGSYN